MRLIKEDTQLDFMGKRHIFSVFSALLILASIAAFFLMGGFNYGIDFRGGTLVQVQFDKPVEIDQIRDNLTQGKVGSFSLQSFGDDTGNEYLVTLAQSDAEKREATTAGGQVENVLKKNYPSIKIRRVESVGPKVGEELKQAAFNAIIFSLVAILFYIWMRFQWRYSLGAIIALAHDVVLVLGLFVLMQKEISLPVVAGILTVAGYSINDTIVIFDRIRENMHHYRKKAPLEIFNQSINQTLSRTLLTSGTTLFVVLSIFLFGGEIIHDFAFALLIGVTTGTYSSVMVASPVVYALLMKFPPKAH